MAKGPGVVTGRYGTIGQVFYIEADYWPLNTTLYVRDFKGNDPRFVSYLLRTLNFRAYSDKGAVPGVNRNHLHEEVVAFPSEISEQRAIAAILSSLDNKIELNGKASATLEAVASTLFKSWFVDFDPVRAKAEGRDYGLLPKIAALFPDSFSASNLGQVPNTWSLCGLDEAATFLNGLAMQRFSPTENEPSLPVIKIAQLRAENVSGADRAKADLEVDYVVENGDVLFSWSGSLECRIWNGGRGALNQHLFKVRGTTVPDWFAYLAVCHHLPAFREIAAGKATTMGHIQRHHLHDAKIVVPASSVIAAANAVIGPMVEASWKRRLESSTLAAIRDALLPRLISGESRILDAEPVLKQFA